VQGSILHLVGALSLVIFGSALAADENDVGPRAVAVAIVFAGLVSGALRWRTLDLASIRGVQGALGPGLLVGPSDIGLAMALAVTGCIAGMAVWRGRGTVRPIRATWPSLAELALMAAAVVTVFAGPGIRGRGAGAGPWLVDVGRWATAVVLVGSIATVGGFLASRLPPVVRWSVLSACALAVAVGALLTAGAT
jgi:hypothetical protein